MIFYIELLLAALLSIFCQPVLASEARLNKALNEEIVFVRNTYGLFNTELETTIFKPSGKGPFPLVVINHGKVPGNPRFQTRNRAIVATREFVRRGYVVMLPMRGGFSNSSGNYIDSGCHVAGNGLTQAEDLRASLDYAASLPYVDRKRILIIGQSHGGLTALAFGTQPYPGVLGLINFAGGLRNANCAAWEGNLIRAFASYGTTNRFPSLWFYGDNDSYFAREVSDEMFARYTAAGGSARLISFGRFKSDAHTLFADREGVTIWWPEVEKFMSELDLPTRVLPRDPIAESPVVRQLQEAGNSPQIATVNCKKLYQAFLEADYPRAFAVSDSGRCGYATGQANPQERAIKFCRSADNADCVLFVIDDQIINKS